LHAYALIDLKIFAACNALWDRRFRLPNSALKDFSSVAVATGSVQRASKPSVLDAKHLQVSMNKYLDMVARTRSIVAQNEVAMKESDE